MASAENKIQNLSLIINSPLIRPVADMQEQECYIRDICLWLHVHVYITSPVGRIPRLIKSSKYIWIIIGYSCADPENFARRGGGGGSGGYLSLSDPPTTTPPSHLDTRMLFQIQKMYQITSYSLTDLQDCKFCFIYFKRNS